jgi:hypothetical protein
MTNAEAAETIRIMLRHTNDVRDGNRTPTAKELREAFSISLLALDELTTVTTQRDIAKKFHDVAVSERNLLIAENQRLRKDKERLWEELNTLLFNKHLNGVLAALKAEHQRETTPNLQSQHQVND